MNSAPDQVDDLTNAQTGNFAGVLKIPLLDYANPSNPRPFIGTIAAVRTDNDEIESLKFIFPKAENVEKFGVPEFGTIAARITFELRRDDGISIYIPELEACEHVFHYGSEGSCVIMISFS